MTKINKNYFKMKLSTREIKSINELPNHFDCIICSSGYESRATFCYSFLSNINFNYKLSFGFTDNLNTVRKINDSFFAEKKFEQINFDGNSSIEIRKKLLLIFEQKFNLNKEVNILVDYSCMTRIWYAEILLFFRTYLNQLKVNLYFFYSFSQYIEPGDATIYNSHVEPISGFSQLTIPEKPTALIIGLGYEKNRAFGLIEYLDAQEVYLFIADRGEADPFKKSVISSNERIIEEVNEDNIFHYPMYDLKYTENTLFKLCKKLMQEFRIIFAPCGPKPFTLLSFLVAIQINEIDVWRISAGNHAPSIDKKATGDYSIYCVQFS